jgi:hypothetical protein
MPQRLTVKAWKARALTDDNRRAEAAWLNEHWTYGGRIHEETATAMIAALNAPSDRAVGHGLFLKLFAEFANALEVAGAWGWAIRTRRDHRAVFDALMTYPMDAPRDFYAAARRNRSGSLVRLLNLPTERKVVGALEATIPEWTHEECRQSLSDCLRQAKTLADRYFAGDEIIRSTYNRAKHGATIVHHSSLTPREFFVAGPRLNISGPRDQARYDLRKFTVNRTMIRSLESGITLAGSMIRYLAGLTKALNEAGVLYPTRRN